MRKKTAKLAVSSIYCQSLHEASFRQAEILEPDAGHLALNEFQIVVISLSRKTEEVNI